MAKKVQPPKKAQVSKKSKAGKAQMKEVMKDVQNIMDNKQEGFVLVIKFKQTGTNSVGEYVNIEGTEFGHKMTPERYSAIVHKMIEKDMPNLIGRTTGLLDSLLKGLNK